jgi:hypothetical protein
MWWSAPEASPTGNSAGRRFLLHGPRAVARFARWLVATNRWPGECVESRGGPFSGVLARFASELVGLDRSRQPLAGDSAQGARQLEHRHRLIFPDLLYVPDTCGGAGVYAMQVNRLKHVGISVSLAKGLRSSRWCRPCVSGARPGPNAAFTVGSLAVETHGCVYLRRSVLQAGPP